MLPAKKNPFLIHLLYIYAQRLYRQHFSHVYFLPGPVGLADTGIFPCTLFGNHHTWWDGMLELLLFRHFGIEWFVMMEEKNLRRFRYFRHCGCFGVDLDDARDGGPALLYSVRLLRNANKERHRLPVRPRVLLLYPHGRLHNLFAPPPEFHPGIEAISRLSRRPAIPLAKYIVTGNEPKPDAWIMLGSPVTPGAPAAAFEEALTHTCAALREKIGREDQTGAVSLF